MNASTLPIAQLLAPLVFVLGAIYLLGPTLPLARTWARAAIFAIVCLLLARYLDWRIVRTVLPAQGTWYEIGWIWMCFAIEMMALADTLILYVTFLRSTDRRVEADKHEATLSSLPPERFPSVDVYIPTYNEPLEVLEKTIIGALCLDYPNFNVWVLDDGRRPWLKNFCETHGAGYLTRPDNFHAKAGNINHALTKTNGEFVAVFDADFIPQRNFLMRTIGFFSDPKIGVVQIPHAFYNYDLLQTNLALRQSLPDDQRFFFETIMPSRDGWDAAFCCGSNSVTRRDALRAIGDALPTQSITEDMLLSITLLRQGYVTRYLCERLAFGLAPESVEAFFVQRQRWARGAIQILYLAAGPLRGRLGFVQRLLFLPTYWIAQSFTLFLTVFSPVIFMWTGIAPLATITIEEVFYYIVPTILAVVGGIWVYAPQNYVPLAGQVLGTLQSFKLMPTVLTTLAKPFGHVFKTTPKGSDAIKSGYKLSGIFWAAATCMVLTVGGLIINMLPDWRIVTQTSLLPMLAFWSCINVLVLFLVCMLSIEAPFRRTEERFDLDEPIMVIDAAGQPAAGWIKDISMYGVGVVVENPTNNIKLGERLQIFLSEVGFIPGTVARQTENLLGIQFELPPSIERNLLIRKLFTAGREAKHDEVNFSAWSATGAMLKSILTVRSRLQAIEPQAASAPDVAKLPPQSMAVPPKSDVAHNLSEHAHARQEWPSHLLATNLARYSHGAPHQPPSADANDAACGPMQEARAK
ncbi:MAG TPA: glycosyltransferase [Xanthobacteraceae bacterium]|nr:glycosyltransferase [Xanthobacteraceae bacterium]